MVLQHLADCEEPILECRLCMACAASSGSVDNVALGIFQLSIPMALIPVVLPLQALLQRLESRVTVKGVLAGCCAGLLHRLFPRGPPGRATERYPPRIFLCAYMVLAHPGRCSSAWFSIFALGMK